MPPRVQILSFWHIKFSKCNHLGSPCPLWGPFPPKGNPGSATEHGEDWQFSISLFTWIVNSWSSIIGVGALRTMQHHYLHAKHMVASILFKIYIYMAVFWVAFAIYCHVGFMISLHVTHREKVCDWGAKWLNDHTWLNPNRHCTYSIFCPEDGPLLVTFKDVQGTGRVSGMQPISDPVGLTSVQLQLTKFSPTSFQGGVTALTYLCHLLANELWVVIAILLFGKR